MMGILLLWLFSVNDYDRDDPTGFKLTLTIISDVAWGMLSLISLVACSFSFVCIYRALKKIATTDRNFQFDFKNLGIHCLAMIVFILDVIACALYIAPNNTQME